MRHLAFLLCVVVALGCDGFVGRTPSGGPWLRLVYGTNSPGKNLVDMDEMVRAVQRRVEMAGIDSAEVRLLGPMQIEILVPQSKPDLVTRIERLLARTGTLEFRVLADRRTNPKLVEQAEKTEDEKIFDEGGELLGWWVPVTRGQKVDFTEAGQIITRSVTRNDSKISEVLVVKDPYDVTGDYLKHVSASVDERGRPCILFTLTRAGGKLFEGLTHEHRPNAAKDLYRQLGIILDGKIQSAPTLQDTIRESGRITGSFTEEEVQDIVGVLNAGSLPASLKKVGLGIVGHR